MNEEGLSVSCSGESLVSNKSSSLNILLPITCLDDNNMIKYEAESFVDTKL